jgi:hypothetical protein
MMDLAITGKLSSHASQVTWSARIEMLDNSAVKATGMAQKMTRPMLTPTTIPTRM